MPWRATAIVILLVIPFVLAGCDGGEEAPAELTPTPGQTPVPTSWTAEPLVCPPQPEPEDFPRIRAFAGQIGAALLSEDADFFLGRMVERELVCTGEEESGPCAGEDAGTTLKGIRIGTWLTSEFILGTADEFREFLSENLGGPGSVGLRLYALAYLEPGRFIAMTAALEEPEGAAKPADAWLMTFAATDDDWQLDQMLYVPPEKIDDWLSEEALSAAWERCVYWERWEVTQSPAGE
jgi:hypothetical protein